MFQRMFSGISGRKKDAVALVLAQELIHKAVTACGSFHGTRYPLVI